MESKLFTSNIFVLAVNGIRICRARVEERNGSRVLNDFLGTVKTAPHECVIRTVNLRHR